MKVETLKEAGKITRRLKDLETYRDNVLRELKSATCNHIDEYSRIVRTEIAEECRKTINRIVDHKKTILELEFEKL